MKLQQIPYHFFGSRPLRFKIPLVIGNDVKVLQNLLNLLPYNVVKNKLNIDGIFGSRTSTAVKEFQKYFKLHADGVVGPETFYRLGHRVGKYAYNEPVFSSRLIKDGIHGADVYVLQNRLAAFRKTYLNRPASGKFDYQTREAVKRFQKDFPDLTADGCVAPQTYDYILVWALMGGRTLKTGRNGLDTFSLQWALFILGYYNRTPDGFFDSFTYKAVRTFQADAGIKIDGVVGTQTFLALGSSTSFPSKDFYYQVKPGDTIHTIASLFNHGMEEIIKLNLLNPRDYTVQPGQMLKIPVPLTFHLVQKGDTLSNLAKKYACPLEDLIRANTLNPEMVLLPDDLVVLPRRRQDFDGTIIYLNQERETSQLKIINFTHNECRVLLDAENVNPPKLFLNKARTKVGMFANSGNLLSYDLEKGISRFISMSRPGYHLDWSWDGHLMVINDGRVLNTLDGDFGFDFKGCFPMWLKDDRTLVYFTENSTFKKVNMETGIIREILDWKEDSIRYFQLKGNSKLFFITLCLPVRQTFSFIYDLLTTELREISSNNYIGVWTRDSDLVLLDSRDYYGQFFPWFYVSLGTYSPGERQINQEFYAKSAEVNPDNFSPGDKYFLFVLPDPAAFYPLPARTRNIYVKQRGSRLITQLTQEEMVYNPIWL